MTYARRLREKLAFDLYTEIAILPMADD